MVLLVIRPPITRRLDLEAVGVLGRVLAVPDHAVDQLAAAHRVALGQADLQLRRGLLVELGLVDLLGHRQVVGVVLQQAPALVLGQEPHAVGQVRVVDRAVVEELHVVGVVPGLAQAVLVAAQDALVDGVDAGVDVGLVGDRLGHLVLVLQAGVDPAAGLEHGHHHGARRVGVLLDELARGAQHLLGMVLPDVLRGGRGDADAVDDGAVVPGLADAEAVHVAHAHVGHHLRRRHGDDLGVLHRVDAAAASQ
jgi:hypothetical protein